MLYGCSNNLYSYVAIMLPIDAHTKLYCVFGNPTRHSLSPRMHNAAFQHFNLNAVYLAFEPVSIEGAIHAMRSLPINGASITIPYKTEILRLIDTISPLAEKIGSVNTLHNSNGVISGDCTDGYGALLCFTGRGISIKNKYVLIIGNGGSARAIAYTLLHEGARVIIAGRNLNRINRLVNDIKLHYNDASSILIPDLTADFFSQIDIIINTTPVGMSPDIDSVPIQPGFLSSRHCVMDIVYSPPETLFLREASAAGCMTIEGRMMLLYQGVRQFEIWTDQKAPVDIMKQALFGS